MTEHVVYPVPIRPDLTVRVTGLPYDLSVAEANKIADVLAAVATGKEQKKDKGNSCGKPSAV